MGEFLRPAPHRPVSRRAFLAAPACLCLLPVCAPFLAAAAPADTAIPEGEQIMSPVTVVATLKAKAGLEDELGRRLYALVAPTRREAGCINYDLHQSTEDLSVWMLYENWTSRAALDDHFEMPYLKEFLAKMHEVLAEDLVIQFFTRLPVSGD